MHNDLLQEYQGSILTAAEADGCPKHGGV